MNSPIQKRSENYYFNMRKFHNYVKRLLYNKYTRNISYLLELAIGKGGDLDKWIKNHIKHVIGYDINDLSINECKRRISTRISTQNDNNIDINCHSLDLSRNILNGNKQYDVISCMFAFHYFFESKETFNTILTSIENNLKVGGIFMGTMFDGEMINTLLKTQDEYELKDDTNTSRFVIHKKNKFTDDIFGNKISVYIKDTVLDEPMNEYIVYFDKFVQLMKTRNFELIESKMFNEYYNESNDVKSNFNDKSNLNVIEKQVSFLNRTFVFKRNLPSKSEPEPELCINENDYLMKCGWNVNEYNMVLLYKYKKGLLNLINEGSNESKKEIEYIIDNFENNEKVLNNVKNQSIKKFYQTIYDKYKQELK
jgi:mRNA (guanine-N7-)-methyltransferase